MQNAKRKMETCVNENVVENKSFQFAVRIVNLYKHLTNDKKEYVMSKQLLRCGTSIGANVAEAERGQTKTDFYAKLSVALKEAHETYYWLRLLNTTEYLTEKEFVSMEKDIKEVIALLITICKTTQQNQK